MPPERFRVVSIPHRPELLDIEDSPINLSEKYKKFLKEKDSSVESIRQNILDFLNQNNNDPSSEEKKSKNNKDYISPLIMNNFMDWLSSTPGKAQQVIDLIKLDREKI